MTRHVLVYDTNRLNPYGRELTRLLAAAGVQVRRCGGGPGPCGRAWTRRRRAADHGGGRASRVATRLLRPLWAALRALALPGDRPALVVVWVRDGWEAALFGLLGRRCVLVHHNPVADRALGPGVARMLPWVLRRCRVVVHAEAFARTGWSVAAHPTYRETVGASCPPASLPADPARRILFAGAVRPDKGAEELPRLIAELDPRFDLVLTEAPPAPAGITHAADRAGLSVTCLGDSGGTDDATFVQAFRDAFAVVAPYTNVTESGTVTMALTLGTPVVAYDAPALRETLVPEALVSTPRDMARRLAAWSERGQAPNCFRESAARRDERATTAWLSVLES